MHVIIHLAVLAVTVFLLATFLPSVRIRSAGTAIIVAIVFSVLNFFLSWLVWVVLFVPAVLTLGLLFLVMPFLVNTAMLWLTDKVMSNFKIESKAGLFISALVITLVNAAYASPHIGEALHGYRGRWA